MNTTNQEAQAHFDKGTQLEVEFKFQEALSEFQKAIDLDNNYILAWYGKGLMLLRLYRFSEAVKVFESIIENNVNLLDKQLEILFQFLSVAGLAMQGKYREAKEKGQKIIEIFEKIDKSKIVIMNNVYNMIGFLYYVSGNLKQAEENFKKEIELFPNDIRPLNNLTKLHIDKGDENIKEQTNEYWKARDFYYKAKTILETLPKKHDDEIFISVQFAQMCSTFEEYDKAEEYCLKIIEKGENYATVDICNQLGYIYFQQKEYKQANRYFLKALKLDRTNLLTKANIAVTHLNLGELDEAEKEYHAILKVTQYNVESHIGLGETYLRMADNGDKDLYKESISYFDKAIELTKQEISASKILKKKEKAAIYYLRGYAKVKLQECLKIKSIKEELLLYEAKKDFQECLKFNPEYHKAKRAIEKINKKINYLNPQRLGSVLIIILALIIFGAGLYSLDAKYLIDVKYSILLLFGGMVFLILGTFFHQLSKFKVGNIELEKSSIDQIAESYNQIDIKLG